MPAKPRATKKKVPPPERAWKLPRGRGGLPPEIVDEIQRERVFAALLPLLAERGYGQTAVNQLLRDAGMSSRTFWELFDSKEDCLLAAYRVFSARLGVELQSAWESQSSWPEQVAAALAAALDFAVAEPEVAHLLLVEAQAAGPATRVAQHQSLQLLAAKLDEGRVQSAAADLNPLTAEVILGGLLALFADRLLAGGVEVLPALRPELLAVSLSPYLGAERAREFAAS